MPKMHERHLDGQLPMYGSARLQMGVKCSFGDLFGTDLAAVLAEPAAGPVGGDTLSELPAAVVTACWNQLAVCRPGAHGAAG